MPHTFRAFRVYKPLQGFPLIEIDIHIAFQYRYITPFIDDDPLESI